MIRKNRKKLENQILTILQ